MTQPTSAPTESGADNHGAGDHLEVGIFDWIDAAGDAADNYEKRLRVVAFAEQAGYDRYHVAEHHGTPLGMAASPNVFLAAVAARTQRIRLGPMVSLPPIFHPLRQIEETGMLDQLSRGRYDLGVGRGSVAFEVKLFGIDPSETRALLDESLSILVQGFVTGRVNHAGARYTIADYMPQIMPYQRPYPPLWYATANLDSAEWLGGHAINVLTWGIGLDGASNASRFLRRYNTAFGEHTGELDRLNAHVARPRRGVMQHVYVADSDAQARREAAAALEVWYANFNTMWRRSTGKDWPHLVFDVDAWIAHGFALVGSARSVAEQLQRLLDMTGANYFGGAFIFGSLSADQAMHSLDLFAREVRPSLKLVQPASEAGAHTA